jgi:hypothetical protein
MRRLLFLFLLCVSFSGFSQESFLINNTQIRFWLRPVLMNNLKFKHYGEKIIQSSPFISFEAGFGIKQRLYENFSLNVDIGYTSVFYHFKFDFEANIEPVQATRHDHLAIEFLQGIYVIPISVQYETLRKGKLNYFAELGIRVNITDQFPYPASVEDGMGYYLGDLVPPDANGNHVVDIFSMRLENKDVLGVFASCFAKAGLVFTSKKTHTLNLSLVAHYFPKPMYKGDYTFLNTPFASYGDVSLGLNYIGLEFAFGLAVHKRIFVPRVTAQTKE